MRATTIIGCLFVSLAACGSTNSISVDGFGYVAEGAGTVPCVADFRATEGDPAWVLGSVQRGFGCLAGYHREHAYPISAALYDLAGSVVAYQAERPETQLASEAWQRAEEIRREAARRLAEAERLQAQAEREAEQAAAARRNAAIVAGFQAGMSIATEAASGDADRTAAAVSEAAAEVGALAIELQREAAEAERELDELGSGVAEVQGQYREIVDATSALAYVTPLETDYAADRLVVAKLVATVAGDAPLAMLERVQAFASNLDVAAADPHLAVLVQRAIDEINRGSTPSESLPPVLEQLAQLEVTAAKFERWGVAMPPAERPAVLVTPPTAPSVVDPFEAAIPDEPAPIDAPESAPIELPRLEPEGTKE